MLRYRDLTDEQKKKITNKLLGWYDSEIHTTIPTPNIEVTEEQWQEAVDKGYTKINEDGTGEVFDFRTADEQLQDTKASKLTQIEDDYTTARTADIAYMNTTFQADLYSQGLIAQNLAVGSVPADFYWSDKANNNVPMTFADLQGLASAIQTRGLTLYAHLQDLKAQVNSATTIAEVDAI